MPEKPSEGERLCERSHAQISIRGMRGFFSFWSRALRHCFSKGWIALGVASTIGSLILPFLRSIDPKASEHVIFWDAVDRYGLAWLCIGMFWIIVLSRFLYAPYFLYREQQTEFGRIRCDLSTQLDAEKSRNEPQFSATIDQVAMGDMPGIGVGIFASLSIYNSGAPSIAEGWSLQIKTDSLDISVQSYVIPEKYEMRDGAGKVIATFHGKEALYEKTGVKPIERGGVVRGWLRYVIPNVTVNQIRIPGHSSATIRFNDILKKEYKATINYTGETVLNEPLYHPGAEQPFKDGFGSNFNVGREPKRPS